MTSNTVYLDYNATAPVRPAVVEAMTEAMAVVGNPSSVHAFGRRARRLLDQARGQVAALVCARPEAVIFTSGGTEANNQALAGARGKAMVSTIEHDSVLRAADGLPRLPVDGDGRLDLERLETLLDRHAPELIAVMLANNETGVIQPIAEVVALAGRRGIKVHCDAVQAAGKLPIDIHALGVDFLSLSAHKLGGPQGVGALVTGTGFEPLALTKGGGQERRLRPGTENLPGIVGFGKAAALAMADDGWTGRVGALRDRLEAVIRRLSPKTRIFGERAPRLANTSCLTMPGVRQETQLMAFDLAGVAVSSGSACSSGKVGPSHVLAAMGGAAEEVESAIRVSFGWASEAGDVDRFVAAFLDLYRRSRMRLTARAPDRFGRASADLG